jgi:Uma2 family endonuclease
MRFRALALGTGCAESPLVSTVLEPSVILASMQLEVIEESEDQRAILDGVSWEVYEALLQSRGERSRPRLTYLDGSLEIMSPSAQHELIGIMIARLVYAYTEEKDLFCNGIGRWTIRRKKSGGLEPDECFTFSAGRKSRPDLALEVNTSRPGLAKLEVYRRLGVREVWVWHKGKVTIHVLEGAGYKVRQRSAFLPDIDLDQLLRFVDTEHQMQAIRAYRAALRGK